MTKPLLVFGYGNLSRGDDALGPLLVDFIERKLACDDIEIQTDFQLQIEHALDLADKKLVLFADASVSSRQAFGFSELAPSRDNTYTTHAMSPEAVLAVFLKITGRLPPPAFLLSIRGERFELGEGLSVAAKQNLNLASQFVGQLFGHADADSWRRLAEQINPKTAHA